MKTEFFFVVRWYIYPIIHWIFVMQYLKTSYTLPWILGDAKYKISIDKFASNHFNKEVHKDISASAV